MRSGGLQGETRQSRTGGGQGTDRSQTEGNILLSLLFVMLLLLLLIALLRLLQVLLKGDREGQGKDWRFALCLSVSV